MRVERYSHVMHLVSTVEGELAEGKTALDAAAKPNDNEYLYWVTINLDTKETKFSKTLAEHNRYVDQYNAWCEDNPGRCV